MVPRLFWRVPSFKQAIEANKKAKPASLFGQMNIHNIDDKVKHKGRLPVRPNVAGRLAKNF